MAVRGNDYITTAVPLYERKGSVTMGLLWLTMLTMLPSALIGFEWHKRGLTFEQVVMSSIVSVAILLAYGIPATQLGARTGLNHTALSRAVFGKIGSWFLTFNVIWLFICFYGLTALYLSDALINLFHWQFPVAAVAATLAILMGFNNYFGFKGVANFARFIAAPVLIVWVGYTFIKAMSLTPPTVFHQLPVVPTATAVPLVSNFLIGLAVWGNECDYWRYAKPRVATTAIPLLGALLLGQILFPVSGWLVSNISGVTDYGPATAFITAFSFGGNALAAAFVLSASNFACNDSNMFGAVQAFENLKPLTHKTWSVIVAGLGALVAASLSIFGVVKSTEVLAGLNSVIMVVPTVIMLGEWLLGSTIFSTCRISKNSVPSYEDVPFMRGPAVASLVIATTFGIVNSGVIPGTQSFNFGIPCAQSWLLALLLYLPLRISEYQILRNQKASRTC